MIVSLSIFFGYGRRILQGSIALKSKHFYLIHDWQIIDLLGDANVPDEQARLASFWKGAAEKAPKVVALFGAKASGKANVLRALAFIFWFMRDSFWA